ncbi:alpha-amylase family glycosyl hydrolase [Hymenobacter convexus]|uniref:alpha-amylase family glycosyl hydrolase n=1 Tax=Hymenobacter sp. CA1UV-4 TaxID=3063782 RepID=UPI00271413AB|nr:alpha-amylase family glycosyl hydrolase [Hymenobacter sp. CA1UV-4]MDO7852619.1 alpha-amylase family glycosyl hydrolase [Hymenobacter sp. CA1UV-4]
MRRRYALLALWLLALLGQFPAAAQTTVKRVVLQAFWWDYYNGNYRFKWADYLTELAPRLKSLGIDAVWIPPTPKNKNATNDVGYSPFDHYDLGDKYQKGDVRTRFGSKDEFLRMVAVLHANGIEVIQDVVLNHADGAGSAANGDGGQDPEPTYSMATNSGYKTFRYSSFATPQPEAGDNGAAYAARQGRWPKNYANFHPHLGHNDTSTDMTGAFFGPDFCYGNDGGNDGYGPLSPGYLALYPGAYNPIQTAGYSQTQARNWALWMKKQTGVDGFRWDAVKHFSYNAQQDLSFNLKYNAGWANGGESMFNVGEFVGGKSDLDGYINNVKGQNGGNDFLMGTFDFGLRGAIYGMVSGNGGYNLSDIPAQQQDQRVAYYAASDTYVHRTVPFVNNHDTFRPQLDATGNYTGWNTNQELAAHIDPFDPRLSAAYAVTFAVDGNPQLFFEDLFNIGGTGKRWTHLPTSTADLPVRDDLVNLIWCHQHLNFKDGAYKVPYASGDHLVIERSTKALIGINDNYNTWQNNTVRTDFAVGTQLKDYSGANGTAVHTVFRGNDGNAYVDVNTPPCDGTALLGRRGYSVWAPVGQDNSTYNPARAAETTQEWEMADDLGDLNCGSLGQGGALPSNSTNTRLVGKIFVQAGQPVSYNLYPEDPSGNTSNLTVGVYDLRGQLLSSATGSGTTNTAAASGTYTASTTGWLALKVRNATATVAGQKCFVKVSYTAPTAVNTLTAPLPTNQVAIWTSNDASADPADCRNWEAGVTPTASTDVLIPAGTSFAPQLGAGTLAAHNLTVESGASLTLAVGTTWQVSGNVLAAGAIGGPGTLELNGNSEQTLSTGSSATLPISILKINNMSNVRLLSPVSVSDALTFTTGHLVVDNQGLTLSSTATISGANASRYVITPEVAAGGGYVARPVPAGGTAVVFPVGTAASYAPVTLTNSGVSTTFQVRTFSGLLANGRSGTPYARQADFVNRTWEATPALTTGPVVDVSVQFEAADQNAAFVPAQASLYGNAGNTGSTWTELGRVGVAGAGPFVATRSGVNSFPLFALGNGTAPLPVTLTQFAAQRSGSNAVRVSWATAQEKNNAGFEIEKSIDGKAFALVATVAAHGGTQPASYTYTDREAPTAAFYRLRQRDLDGSTHFSQVVYVPAAASPYVLVPNPSRGEALQLLGGPILNEDAPLRLTLSNVVGRILFAPAPASRAVLAEQLGSFLRQAAPGVYVISISGPDGVPQRLQMVRE